MDRLQLIRADTVLGVVTHAPEERVDGGPWDVGWLEPAPEYEAVRQLFEREQQLFDEYVRLEMEVGNSGSATEATCLLDQAAELQREIMRPGVQFVDLPNGRRSDVTELHIEGAKVFWR
jgi:hypothetical protein